MNKLGNELSLEALFSQIEEIKDNGDLVFVKFDGERDSNQITVIISILSNKDRPQIRYDGSNLKDLIKMALDKYYLKNDSI